MVRGMRQTPPEIENLRLVAREYARLTKKSLPAVSREIYGNTSFFKGIFADQSVTVHKLHEVLEAFRERWPEGAPWPMCRVVTYPGPRKLSPAKRRAA